MISEYELSALQEKISYHLVEIRSHTQYIESLLPELDRAKEALLELDKAKEALLKT